MVPILNHFLFININNNIVKLIIEIVITRGLYITIFFVLNLIDSMATKKILRGLFRCNVPGPLARPRPLISISLRALLISLRAILGIVDSPPNNAATVHLITKGTFLTKLIL